MAAPKTPNTEAARAARAANARQRRIDAAIRVLRTEKEPVLTRADVVETLREHDHSRTSFPHWLRGYFGIDDVESRARE